MRTVPQPSIVFDSLIAAGDLVPTFEQLREWATSLTKSGYGDYVPVPRTRLSKLIALLYAERPDPERAR